MSLRLLIDGYNLVPPIPDPRSPQSSWLEKQRNSLLRDLARHLEPKIRKRTCIVFDANNAPPGRPEEFAYQGMLIRFAVDYLSADELIQELIQIHHAPKQLMVVSSDHQIQIVAQRRGAAFCDGDPWLDDLTDGRVRLSDGYQRKQAQKRSENGGAGQGGHRKPGISDAEEVDQWMREFGFDDD